MKIVNLDQFVALPAGTVFAKYEPSVFGDMMVKGDSIPETKDFLYQQLVDAIENIGTEEFCARLDSAQCEGTSIPMDFYCMGRDGCFESNQLFAVFERADLVGLIERLQTALREGYET